MSQGGKRYFNKNKNSGNWFMHIGTPQTEQTRELCTSTGSMLAHGVPQPLIQGEKRYPKIFINLEKKTIGRDFTFSAHDNRAALQDAIDVYDQGFGRKKCLDERRQHNSHFCLCHHDTPLGSEKRDHSAYQTDFLPKQETEATGATITRRFPRNHSARSQINAQAQAGECFMWFGKHNSKETISLSVLATSNH
ncbi:testis-expressed protein 36 [Triplophysa rosa]|uniref:Testis-expressed sequence 36 protein n=1 Tax=Triplophysa rosa TaxID=992332 RepID=A0A9W8C0G7_TRIRA|nr:testis-expressed protein 36 [Triplophysa rosa]KAI7804957.1 putative testis-expressed sequence 36 protein [Triplophysa rosa]